jgi:glutamate N-acetyltransferase / amino-acid N-acetyltransferase
MATMLGYLSWDGGVPAEVWQADVWQAVVSRAVACSFNAITVDGDTSTNDTFLAFAAGEPLGPEHFEALEAGLTAVSQHLLQSVRSIGAQQHRLHDGNRKPVATMVRGWSFWMGHEWVTTVSLHM